MADAHETSHDVLLHRYTELRDEVRDLVSADPQTSPNSYDTYLYLCKKHNYRVEDVYLEYLEEYAAVQAAIAAGKGADVAASVRCLSFEATYVGQLSWLPIFATLTDCVLLRSLSLPGQQLDSSMIYLLVDSLLSLPSLTHLDLSWNPIGCAGIQDLIKLVQESPYLVDCDIPGASSVAHLTRKLEYALDRNRKSSI